MIKYIIRDYCNNTNDIHEIDNIFSNMIKIMDCYKFIDSENYKYPLTMENHDNIKKVLGYKTKKIN